MPLHWPYASCLLLHILLLLTLDGATAQVATFNVTNFVSLTLNDSAADAAAASATASVVATFQLRTSHAAWAVWGIRAAVEGDANATDDDQQLLRIGLTLDQLTLEWPGGNSQVSVRLADGNWHSIRVRLDNASGVTVGADDADALARLPWNLPTPPTPLTMTFGGVNGTGGLRGCLANASVAVDGENVTMVALYGNSTAGAPESPGCREDPCGCANGGRCPPGSQWNLRADDCNCSGTAHEGPLCQQAIDFCQPRAGNVSNGSNSSERCSGHGQCTSVTELASFICNCTAGGWLGSRCQSRDPCGAADACGGRGNCSRLGDPDLPGNLTRRCRCDPGHWGAACSDQLSDSGGTDTRLVVGLVVGILLLLLVGTAAGLAGKLVRDRRKDTGIYKPSDREIGGGGGRGQSMRDILHPPNEERLI